MEVLLEYPAKLTSGQYLDQSTLPTVGYIQTVSIMKPYFKTIHMDTGAVFSVVLSTYSTGGIFHIPLVSAVSASPLPNCEL
jgi:hypothetical protein